MSPQRLPAAGTAFGRYVKVAAFLATVFLFAVPSTAALAKYASIVIDAGSGQVLHAINADTRNYPASLTKMMTLYLTFEALKTGRLKPTQKISVSARAAGQVPSKLNLKAGDKITVEEAVLALVTKSANDVATVLAEALGGTEKNFATIMTRQARALGMTRTTFRNASGLPNRRQLTTARDLARLSLALIRDFPDRYRRFATRTFKFRGRNYRNHNNLLASYDGADGIKTGYIRASGYNLAASAERDGIRLIGVVMGGKSARKRDRHMARLLDKAFAAARAINVAAASNGAVVAKEKPMASGHGWSVQVGAFHRFGQAHLAVARSVRLAPRLLFKADIWISTVQGKKRTLYRARLTGLTKKRATEVCQALISRKMDCLAVAPPPGVNLALNPN